MLRTFANQFLLKTSHVGVLPVAMRSLAGTSLTEGNPEEFKWEDIQSMVHSSEAKADLNKLQAMVLTTEKMLTDVSEVKKCREGAIRASNKKKVEVNWAEWKKRLSPNMVEKYQAAYEEIAKDELQHTSEFDLDAWSKSFESVVEKAKALEASSVERIKVLEQELVEIQAEMDRMASVTVDEELAANPDMAKEIDEEISQQNYY